MWEGIGLTAILIAVFGRSAAKYVSGLIFKPNLKPNDEILRIEQPGEVVYRLQIQNEGKDTAREVEVSVTEISDDGVRRDNFLPVPLRWTHFQSGTSGPAKRDIHRNQSVYLDLCALQIDNKDLRITSAIGMRDEICRILRSDLPPDLQGFYDHYLKQSVGTHYDLINDWLQTGTIQRNCESKLKLEIYQQSGHSPSINIEIKWEGDKDPEFIITNIS